MVKNVPSLIVVCSLALPILFGCTSDDERNGSFSVEKQIEITLKDEPTHFQKNEFSFAPYDRSPAEWGMDVTGVRTTFQTDQQEIALTFDACGGPFGNEIDQELIDFLREKSIQATLFINERWIMDNRDAFLKLAADPLFQIENHGTTHAPLSVQGGEAWGIEATSSPEDVYAEIMDQHETVSELTGRQMTLFRSGTAYYDEVAVQLAQDLGYEVVNFSVLGDAGATYSSTQVEQALLTATNGSIVLLHMNQPSSGTYEGVKQAIPILRERGFTFVQLQGQTLQ